MIRKNFTNYGFILLMGLSMSIFISSCGKDDDPKPVVQDNSANEPIAKKWEVNNTGASSGRVSSEAGDFLWFEFTVEGYYIVLKSNLETYTGTYTFVDNTITLDDFGVLEISDLSDSDFSFTFTAIGETESVNIFTTVAEEVIETTSKTALMCKTWSVKKQTGELLGTDINLTYPNAQIASMTVVFSPYGTYLVSTEYATGQKQIMNRLWRWKDSEETMICFGDLSSECNGENETTILELNEADFKLHTINSYADVIDELVVFNK